MTRAWTAGLVGLAMLAIGVASAVIVVGSKDLAGVLFDTELDAFPYRMGLILAVVAAMPAIFFIPATSARRGRCAMAFQALLFFCMFLNGVEVVTPFQLSVGACLIAAIGFLALGRFEPKPPEQRP